MRFITIKTRVTIYFTLMMLLVVALVIVFMLVVAGNEIENSAESTLLDVVHDNIDDVEYDDGFLDLDELNFYPRPRVEGDPVDFLAFGTWYISTHALA